MENEFFFFNLENTYDAAGFIRIIAGVSIDRFDR